MDGRAGSLCLTPTGAIYHATGYQCMDLPITPEKILNAVKAKSKKRKVQER